MELEGYVSPRYLDRNWYRNFTVTQNRNNEIDIPVKIIIEDECFETSKISNPAISYRELLIENARLRNELEYYSTHSTMCKGK